MASASASQCINFHIALISSTLHCFPLHTFDVPPSFRFLKYGDRERIAKELRNGDVVERHIADGALSKHGLRPTVPPGVLVGCIVGSRHFGGGGRAGRRGNAEAVSSPGGAHLAFSRACCVALVTLFPKDRERK